MPEALKDMQQALAHDPELKAAAVFVRDHIPENKEGKRTILKISPLLITSAPPPWEAEVGRVLRMRTQQRER
jgi:hypothetical protein